MRLLHRGLDIALPDDDARVSVIEALLFGRTLPPPLPLPQPAEARPPPAPVPPEVEAFWQDLPERARHELTLLAQREHLPADLERALGIPNRLLRGQHSQLARRAHRRGLPMPVRRRGRGRAERRFFVAPELLEHVRTLVARDAQPAPARTPA